MSLLKVNSDVLVRSGKDCFIGKILEVAENPPHLKGISKYKVRIQSTGQEVWISKPNLTALSEIFWIHQSHRAGSLKEGETSEV